MFYDSKEVYYIHSSLRVSGTSSNFLYKLDIPTDVTFDYVGVLNASIPKSYYLIDDYNDTFTLIEGVSSVVIAVPHGNYTLNQFRTVLGTQLTQSSPHGWTYSISFPTGNVTNTGKFTYLVQGNGGTQPSFLFQESLYEQMGFDQGTYTFVGDSLTSTNVINLQLLSSLYIHTDMCSNKDNSILQEVYSNNSDFSNIVYQATEFESYAKKFVTKNNNVYRFTLTDEYGNLINLNGQHWHFTLVCFKRNNLPQLIQDYMHYQLIKE